MADSAEKSASKGEKYVHKPVASFFVKGQRVIARFKGRDLYPGTVADCQLFTKTYSIAYDDGDHEDNVPLVRVVNDKF